MTTTRSRTASPRKDPNTGTWEFFVDVGSQSGKRKMAHRRGFATKREAQAALDAIRTDVRKATYVAPAKMTCAEYFTAWLAGLPATGLRTSTVDGYRRNLDYVTDRPAIAASSSSAPSTSTRCTRSCSSPGVGSARAMVSRPARSDTCT